MVVFYELGLNIFFGLGPERVPQQGRKPDWEIPDVQADPPEKSGDLSA